MSPRTNVFSWPAPGIDRSMWRFRRHFPVDPGAVPVTMGEGGTPLSPSRLRAGTTFLWKEECRNPTGSHKDRALSLAATHARQIGAKLMAVVSAGSTGISNAAYAARAGLPSITFMGRGAPFERIRPVFAFGSRLIEVDAGIDHVIEAVRLLSGRGGLYVASTAAKSNPIQAEACRTIAYEIVESLGAAPDWLIVPVGGGGTIAAMWRGFGDLAEAGLIDKRPRLVAAVPRAYDALAVALKRGIVSQSEIEELPYRDDVETILTKLSHAHPPDGQEALGALRESDGLVLAFDDEEALTAVDQIARADGLYVEPSTAIVLPALDRMIERGLVQSTDVVVGLACGSGFRETSVLQARRPLQLERIKLRELADLFSAGA
jgi:threonine synthase